MSKKHPIIAVTGSSGAGTSNIRIAFEKIFNRLGVNAALIEGDSYHRYDRKAMDQLAAEARDSGKNNITHFGPEGNLFPELEASFKEYAEFGTGKQRHYIHSEEQSDRYNCPPGSLTPWENLPDNTDLMFYEGLHGGLITEEINVARHVDMLIGITPIINLEWIQKIQRDKAVRGYTAEDATNMILSRMHDYVHYITPQFSRTDMNLQRVPTVDTANPFGAAHVPSSDESFAVIHVRNRDKLKVDFLYLLEMLHGSFMSTPYTLVIPAGKTNFAIELIIEPIIRQIIENRTAAAPTASPR